MGCAGCTKIGSKFGRMAQLVEHIVHIDGVTGSSPVATTKIPGRKAWDSSLSPVFRRNTRLGLQHEPGSFVNLSDQPRRDSIPRGFSRICRVPRVRRVIRVRIGQRPGDLLSLRAYCRSFLSHLQNDSSIFIVVAIMRQLGIDE